MAFGCRMFAFGSCGINLFGKIVRKGKKNNVKDLRLINIGGPIVLYIT
ncbi:hypothetical protein KLEB273_gp274 [Bacillus phage vB_BauM_KLEB27-3]|nr:hypothetical protein KLEB273_gp274 [Bacillus phage vB_BauM_KLEB27-3]